MKKIPQWKLNNLKKQSSFKREHSGKKHFFDPPIKRCPKCGHPYSSQLHWQKCFYSHRVKG